MDTYIRTDTDRQTDRYRKRPRQTEREGIFNEDGGKAKLGILDAQR